MFLGALRVSVGLLGNVNVKTRHQRPNRAHPLKDSLGGKPGGATWARGDSARRINSSGVYIIDMTAGAK